MKWREFIVSGRSADLYCREAGSGAPLVMIHGAACDSDYFFAAAEILAASRRVILYDRRGYGRSTGGDARYPDRLSLCAEHASDLAAVVNTAGGRADICACSVGAVIALHLAASKPEMIARLIVHEPPLSEFIPAGHHIFEDNAYISKIKAVSFAKAYSRFLTTQGEADERAKPLGDEEIEMVEHNGEHYFAAEQEHIYSRRNHLPVLPSNLRISIGLGERSIGGDCEICTKKLAEVCLRQVIPFPGGHNAAREIPSGFAAIIEGILALDL